MKPLADFACLGRKCATPEGATVHELPIDAKFCPVCGSKRVQRLFNRIAVLRGARPDPNWKLTSNSHLVRSTALLQPGFDEADKRKPPKDLPTYAFSASQVDGFSQGKGRPMTEMEQASLARTDRRAGAPSALTLVRSLRGRIPTEVVARDTGT